MANWWDYWSPGLQATGGLIELLGLWHLVHEWRFSMLENEVKSRLDESQGSLEFLKLLDDAFRNLSQKVGECGIEWSPSWLKEIGDRVASIEEKIDTLKSYTRVHRALSFILGNVDTLLAFCL